MPALSDDQRDALRATVAERFDDHIAALVDLSRIPSISAPGYDATEVRRAAEATRDLLEATGFEGARVLEVPDSHPAVYAERLDAGPGAPTILCYAHHDVQPTGDEASWTSPPFSPTVRDGRLYGRGTADDKAGIIAHVAAMDAWLRTAGSPPCNVKVIIEGEEETGSEHLGALLDAYADLLRSDVIVIADSVNWKVGVPSLTYLLRGLVDATVEVRGLDHGVHSGMYGGPVADPMTGLVRLLSGLTDEHGAVAIPGFADDVRAPSEDELSRLHALDFDTATFREEAGVLDGVDLIGVPGTHPLESLWMRPNLTVIGIDATSVAASSNTIVPSARAKVSVRLGPGQDPQRALDHLCAHLRTAVPWGLQVEVTPGASAAPFAADPAGPAYTAALRAMGDAYGEPAVLAGLGGSIPFIEPFADAFASADGTPAPALLTGVEDPDSRAHGVDESLHLEDFHRACVAHAFLLGELADSLGGS